MSGNRHKPRLARVLVLPMTPAHPGNIPSIRLDEPYDLANLRRDGNLADNTTRDHKECRLLFTPFFPPPSVVQFRRAGGRARLATENAKAAKTAERTPA